VCRSFNVPRSTLIDTLAGVGWIGPAQMFMLGAFKVAADANLAILPGVIRGTRSMLRGDQWFPRYAAISVEIGEPVMPSGTDFRSLLRLRDSVRGIMLSRCGEPDLEELIKPELPQAKA
jgi:1-acyl-sn-glycerol-3-phosphate acyltransferase